MPSKVSFQTKDDPEIAGIINAASLDMIKGIDAHSVIKNCGNVRIRINRSKVAEDACADMMWDLDTNKARATPAQVVARFVSIVGPKILADPTALHEWMWNEPAVDLGGRFDNGKAMRKWLADCAIAFMQWADSVGVKVIIFTFGAEANIYDKCEELRAAFEYAYTHGHVYGPHGYSSPNILTFRDLQLNHELLRTVLGFMPFVVYTEGTIDNVRGTGYDGWRTCLSLDAYYNQTVNEYEPALDADPDVVGTVLYIWTKQPGDEMYGYEKGRGDAEHPGQKFVTHFKSHNSPRVVIRARKLPGGADPEPPPPPPPPGPVVLWSFKPDKYRYTFMPGDTYGDRTMPVDENKNPEFEYFWNEPDAKITHVEYYPPVGSGYTIPAALRVQNQAPKVSFWMVKTFVTSPGEKLQFDVHTLAEFEDKTVTGLIERAIVVDRNGGKDALSTAPGMISKSFSATGPSSLSLEVIATGPITSVMYLTRCKVPARINVDWSDFKISRLTASPNPAPGAGWAYLAWELNLRNTPVLMGDGSNLLMLVETGRHTYLTGNRKNGYAEVLYELDFDVEGSPYTQPPYVRKAWLYDQGGLIREVG